MNDVFEAFLTDPVRVNPHVYRLWLDGQHANEALVMRLRNDNGQPSNSSTQDEARLRELVWRDTVDQYRLYEKLEHYLIHPELLGSQLLFQIPPQQQQLMLEGYYALDGRIGRWVAGHRHKTQAPLDLEAIANAAQQSPTQCRRQSENLDRVYLYLEEHAFHFGGLSCSLAIQRRFRLSGPLSAHYACALFLRHMRFDLHPTNRITGFLRWQDLLFFAAALLTHWVPQANRQPLVPASGEQSSAPAEGEKNEVTDVAMRSGGTWPSLEAVRKRLPPTSIREALGFDLSGNMTSALRDLKAHLINDTEALRSYRQTVLQKLHETYSHEELQELEQRLYLIVHALLIIGAELSQPKELKDLLEDWITQVAKVLKDCHVRSRQIDDIFSALIDSMASVDVWYLHNEQTRPVVLQSYERFLSITRLFLRTTYDHLDV